MPIAFAAELQCREISFAGGPCLIHASVERAELVLPMVPPGAANTRMIVHGAEPARELVAT